MSPKLCRALTLTTVVALLWGCKEEARAVSVGYKNFKEQRILAETLRALIQHAGMNVDLVPCEDTWECRRALSDGRVHVMVEYVGTALRYAGAGSVSPDPLAQVQRIDEDAGLSWLGTLGFDNGYRVLVRPETAQRQHWRTIADLGQAPRLRLACPPEYLRRPRDGLASLVRRHGLTLDGRPLSIEKPSDRYRALLEGRVDAVIGYATDEDLIGLSLVPLDDSLGFFPPYDAGIVVTAMAQSRWPKLRAALSPLLNGITVDGMRRFNYAVGVEGRAPAVVATELAASVGVELGTETRDGDGPVVRIAASSEDRLVGYSPRVLRAVRSALPNHSAKLVPSDNPSDEVRAQRAELALLGAERFFDDEGNVQPGLDAVAVVAVRHLHLITRRNGSAPLSGPSGVMSGGGAQIIGTRALKALGKAPQTDGSIPELLGQLDSGALQTAIVVTEAGDPVLTDALKSGAYVVHSVSSIGGSPLPFLQLARIPKDTYAGQPRPIDTLAAQLLVAVRALPDARTQLRDGPAGALGTSQFTLTREQVDTLAQSCGSPEAPDPVLPSAWKTAQAAAKVQNTIPWLDTTLNVLAIAFLFALGRLMVLPIQEHTSDHT